MATRRLPNYLRTHRKYSGLSQSEVSFLIRLKDKSELSRYERSLRQPSLRTALACQEVFGTPVSELFGGLNDSVARGARGKALLPSQHLDAGCSDDFSRKAAKCGYSIVM